MFGVLLPGVDMLPGVLEFGVLALVAVVLFGEVLFIPEFTPLFVARGSASQPMLEPEMKMVSVTQSKIGVMRK
jgi:hypothetical protein